MTLGERIKMLRQKAGLTQEELAKEIGYSTKTSISKIENDVLDINQSTTVALARALKTTPSVIMGWEEPEELITQQSSSGSGVGERIHARRESLGITVDELAEILGKNRATIYRYESNDIENLPVSIIVPLANALRCSPAYLMGWTNSDGQTGNTPQEETLLSNYRQLNPDGQKKVDGYVEDLVKGGIYSNTETKTLAAYGGAETVTVNKDALDAAVEKLLKEKGLI